MRIKIESRLSSLFFSVFVVCVSSNLEMWRRKEGSSMIKIVIVVLHGGEAKRKLIAGE